MGGQTSTKVMCYCKSRGSYENIVQSYPANFLRGSPDGCGEVAEGGGKGRGTVRIPMPRMEEMRNYSLAPSTLGFQDILFTVA